MITEDLILYIQTKRKENISDEEIRAKLALAGWHTDDIQEGFMKIAPPIVTPKAVIKEFVAENTPVLSTQVKIDSRANKSVDPYRESPDTLVKPLAPIIPKAQVEPKIMDSGVVVSNFKTTSYKMPESTKQVPEISAEPTAPSTSFSPQSPTEVKPIFAREELMPTLNPKVQPFQNASVPPQKSLAQQAVLSTLSRDILATEATITEEAPRSNTKKFAIALIIILIVSAIGGTVFAMVSGYIPFPSFSFIKKDPKVLLLSSQALLGSLDSYSSETLLDVSLPSVANITNGLISGDAITSNDRDSVSLDAMGVVRNNKNSLTSASSKYTFHIKSSLIKNDINSEFVYANGTSFVTIPNMSKLLGDDSLPQGVLVVKSNQLDSLLSLIPDAYAEIVREKDINKILTNGIPSNIKDKIDSSLKDLVNSATVTEKAPEDIRGFSTYHYQLVIDRPTTKKFLNSVFDSFAIVLSENQKKNLDEALGATNIDTFEVWIGKNDGMLYRYKASVSLPLSKVINLDDRGIAGNQVIITLQNTFYDMNMPKSISIPENTISVDDFIKASTDKKIKAELSLFSTFAKTFHNAIGSYGSRANPAGSCANPNPGSIFSPVGHAKGASAAVGNIASTMNNILNLTNGAGSCFSTSSGWAVALPQASDDSSAYCVDSMGSSVNLKTPLKGITCK